MTARRATARPTVRGLQHFHRMTAGSRAALTAVEDRQKDLVLTQPEASKVRDTSAAIVLKHGRLFLLSGRDGDVPWDLPHGLGLFMDDCRFLDGYLLRIDGAPPTLLSAADTRGFETRHELANPRIEDGAGRSFAANTIAVRRERLVRADVVHELLSVANFGDTRARFALTLRFRARFEDIFIVKRFVDGPRGVLQAPRVAAADRVELAYDGRDERRRTTTLTFSPAPDHLDAQTATFQCDLGPGERREVAINIVPRIEDKPSHEPARPGTSPAALRRWLERVEKMWLGSSAEVRTSNPLFDRVVRRSLLDLRVLRSSVDGHHFFAAGVPWFVTLFGRDAATVAIQTLPFGCEMARETLRLLARYQATGFDPYRDAEPGKILHELREGELARVGALPQSPAYYGAVDATPLFLILLAEYVAWSGDFALARALRPNVDAALGWIERHGDHDGDGFLDYVGRYEHALINQGWKDSGNAILDADGSLPTPPIAVCEVQSYAHRALCQTAAVLRALGEGALAEDVDGRAVALRTRFEAAFWSEALGCYRLALQRDGRPVDVVASNAGQVLWGGIASAERGARVAARLMEDDMFSGWGIRTLSTQAIGYNPISYHRGSVWPHDNALIITGMRRYGQDQAALRAFDAIFEAAAMFRHYRLPELYCGYGRKETEDRPVRYPVACSPQAWAAGAIPHALWNLLGLRADAGERRLCVVRPRLPRSLDWLEIHGLRVADAVADIRFTRARDGTVDLDARLRTGNLRVERTDTLPDADAFASQAAA
jgi:glycogen debranching enzyme